MEKHRGVARLKRGGGGGEGGGGGGEFWRFDNFLVRYYCEGFFWHWEPYLKMNGKLFFSIVCCGKYNTACN